MNVLQATGSKVARAVRIQLVVARDNPYFALIFQTNLRGSTATVTCRMKGNRYAVVANFLAIRQCSSAMSQPRLKDSRPGRRRQDTGRGQGKRDRMGVRYDRSLHRGTMGQYKNFLACKTTPPSAATTRSGIFSMSNHKVD